MNYLGFAIIVTALLYFDYKMYIRGNANLFFKDKTQLEKDLREIQKLEVKIKLENLKKQIEEQTNE